MSVQQSIWGYDAVAFRHVLDMLCIKIMEFKMLIIQRELTQYMRLTPAGKV